ncbi:efflux RND transporter permease subunit [Fuchsiella alkaliacetigena]|uniref:efflux RND transporter permease subunit n=1 Tax=Fuchsiella alkaliacetigena TaxID=957042 RepID=UPI00200B22C0|nr:efflux RND transporter permease subunit [Fuchsiella alkaliacetigena]MCK8823589.1 efflux RND transporter permease subunit [Fuchsiella alkaliacetigena]
MKLSDFSVDRPVTTVMLVLLILLLGAIALLGLPVDLMPEMELPYAAVMTSYEGADPYEIEDGLTRPIEESMGTIDNVENVSSVSSPGNSLVFIEFDWGTDMDFAIQDVRENISMIQDYLPDDADQPMSLRFDPAMMPIMQIGLSSNMDLETLRNLAEDRFENDLERIPGVASVNISGGLEREIQVNVNQERMEAYGFTIDQVASSIGQENLDIAGGSINHGSKELLLRTQGEFQSLDEIKNLELQNEEGQKVSLREFAQVEDTHKERSSYTYLNGEESIGLAIQKQSDANTVQVANAVKEELANLEAEFGDNIEIEIVNNQAEFIQDSIDNVRNNGIIGAVLAAIILLLFLRNIRSTFIIGTAIPISIIATFILMYFSDLTLNLMTLGGLALGIGMLVDNAIVVLENIYRHQQEGLSRIQAAKDGAGEVGTAILASTLTTAAVFLPIAFVEGLAAQLFGSLALTVAFSLLASLVIALTLIPMLSSKLLNVKEEKTPKETVDNLGIVNKIYKRLLNFSLDYRYAVAVVITIGVILFGLGLQTGVIPLETEFMPDVDQGSFTVDVELPEGERLSETDRTVKEIEEHIRAIPEVRSFYSDVGSTGFMGGAEEGSNEGSISVDLVELAARDRSTTEVVEQLRGELAYIPDAQIAIRAETGLGGGGQGSPIEVNIRGADLDILTELSTDIQQEVESVEGTRNVELSVSESRPEVQVDIQREMARELGFSVSQIGSTVRSSIRGDIATQYKEGGEEFDLRVQMETEGDNTLSQLENLRLTSPAGAVVPLDQLAEVELAEGMTSIERDGQQRSITVNTDIYGRSLGVVESDIRQRVDELDIPAGYTVEYGGEAEDMQETFGDLGFALILAVVLVYMVMASQFESLVHPFTIMFTVPLALLGAILGLVVVGAPLSVPAIIGVIMLAGIVVNNAIVLVDYINVRRTEYAEDKRTAILEAGPIRLRPIMMTALTTILGLLPLALGIGDGAEAQQPMAVVVIGGLLFATILTLIIIPVVYYILDGWGEWLKNLLGWAEEVEEGLEA